MSTKYNPDGIPVTIEEFLRQHKYVGYDDYTLSGKMIVTVQTNDGQKIGSEISTTPTLVITADSKTVTKDGTITLVAKYDGSDVTSSVTFTSSDTSIATVSGAVVTGVAAGNVTITGSYTVDETTVTATIALVVKEAAVTYTGYWGYLEDSTESSSSAELTITADQITGLANTVTLSSVALSLSDTGTAPETENQLYLVYAFPTSLGTISSVQTYDLSQWNDLAYNTKSVTINNTAYTIIISNDTFETSNATVKFS